MEAIAVALSEAKPYAAVADPAPRAGRAKAVSAVIAATLTPGTSLPSPVAPPAPPTTPASASVRTGKSKDGRNYARVTGPKDEAEKVRAGYALQGKQTSPLQKDRFKNGAWFFYWE